MCSRGRQSAAGFWICPTLLPLSLKNRRIPLRVPTQVVSMDFKVVPSNPVTNSKSCLAGYEEGHRPRPDFGIVRRRFKIKHVGK